MIQSDFATLEAETKGSEVEAQKEFDEFVHDSAMDKAQRQSDVEHKSAKKQNQAEELQEKKADLEGTRKELDTAMAYFDKLKPSCIDAGTSYEDGRGRGCSRGHGHGRGRRVVGNGRGEEERPSGRVAGVCRVGAVVVAFVGGLAGGGEQDKNERISSMRFHGGHSWLPRGPSRAWRQCGSWPTAVL